MGKKLPPKKTKSKLREFVEAVLMAVVIAGFIISFIVVIIRNKARLKALLIKTFNLNVCPASL